MSRVIVKPYSTGTSPVGMPPKFLTVSPSAIGVHGLTVRGHYLHLRRYRSMTSHLPVFARKKGAWFKKGSGTVAGTARRVLRTTVPDPFLNHAKKGYSADLCRTRRSR